MSLLNKLTKIEKYIFPPSIQDAINTVCKATQILVDTIWGTLSQVERNNVTCNLNYIVMMMSNIGLESKSSLRNAKSAIFMQIQGSTALCGLCALNNAYQVNVFDNVMLNQLADELWIKHYTELEMPMTEKYTPLRDENGYYSIEVLLKAIKNHGDIPTCLNNEVSMYFDKPSNCVNIMDIINSCNRYPVSYLIRVPRTDHYIAIVCKGLTEMYLLDSLKSLPIVIYHAQLAEYLLTMYNDPLFGIYGLRIPEREVEKVYAQPIWCCHVLKHSIQGHVDI